MPTYLCHGFRWHRQSVRYFIAKHDIEDGATEWIVAPRSQGALLEQFYDLYDFLPPIHNRAAATKPPSRDNCPTTPNYRRHHYAASNDSSYVSRTSSSEHRPSEEQQQYSKSRRNSKSMSRPQTSAREDNTNTQNPFASAFSPPLLSPSSLMTDDSGNYFNELLPIKMLEEFDPKDESRVSAPWAYVADHVIKVGTSVSIADEMFQYEARTKRDPNKAMQGPSDEYGRKVLGGGSKKAGWFEKLRDQLQRGESIRWYVVVCGDEERENPSGYDDDDELLEEDEEEEEVEEDGEEGVEEEEERIYPEDFGATSSANPQDRTWVRQSRSTQSTEATSTTTTTTTGATSVIDGGFEYRIPELAGLVPKTPSLLPERKRKQQLQQALTQKDLPPMPTSPPPKTPVSRQSISRESTPRGSGGGSGSLDPSSYNKNRSLKSVRSTLGIRKLFSRRSTETSV